MVQDWECMGSHWGTALISNRKVYSTVFLEKDAFLHDVWSKRRFLSKREAPISHLASNSGHNGKLKYIFFRPLFSNFEYVWRSVWRRSWIRFICLFFYDFHYYLYLFIYLLMYFYIYIHLQINILMPSWCLNSILRPVFCINFSRRIQIS